MTILAVQNLRKSFGSKVVLDDISFEINEQESFVVIGGSGSGKSVLIKCLIGLLESDQGDIWIKGKNIKNLSTRERQELYKDFGMLFQSGALFDSLTVADNISFGLAQGKPSKKKQFQSLVLEKLKSVGLKPETLDLYPSELSGGMQKRVALARAIAGNPDFIFFDEPTSGLDPIVSSTINALIKKCVEELGASALTITHDMNSLRHIGNRVALLYQGKFIWSGTIFEMDMTDNPYVQQFIHGNPEGPIQVL